MLAPIIGLLAYATGLAKALIIEPIGGWFGDLAPNQKVAIVTLLVVATLSTLAWQRSQRRRSVRATNALIDRTLDA